MKELLKKITSQNKLRLIEVEPLSGGNINQVFLLKCKQGKFVAKLNSTSKFPSMFAAEAKGLALLQTSESFKIPKVLASGTTENSSYLLMEYISKRRPNPGFWNEFAEKLTKLHKTTNSNFGLDHSNYIGGLPQQNDYCSSASEFYITQRLEPQFKMALDCGFHFKNLENFTKTFPRKSRTNHPR